MHTGTDDGDDDGSSKSSEGVGATLYLRAGGAFSRH